MSDARGTFDKLVRLFEILVNTTVQGAYESDTFIELLCGPRCLLTQVVLALLKEQPAARPVERFTQHLTTLEERITTGAVPSVFRAPKDSTAAPRWTALVHLIRSQLVETTSLEFGSHLQSAKADFDEVGKQAQGKVDLPAPPWGDPATAETTDPDLFSKVAGPLGNWTIGTWMVWDVLCQWNQTAPPVATERTPVLFASGSHGQVLRLVVEALPGPPGLVTPHAGQLGLCAFSTEDAERLLLPAIDRMLGLGSRNGPGLRLRWYLDADQRDAWKFGLAGHSVEAAAAVAALAVVEQAQEQKQHAGERMGRPILDARTVVTAVVGNGRTANFDAWPLEPVNPDTLDAKLAAAQENGLDVVGVAPDQIVVHAGVRIVKLPSVGEAFELLRAVNRAFDRYGDYVRSEFHYHEEGSPRPEGRG